MKMSIGHSVNDNRNIKRRWNKIISDTNNGRINGNVKDSIYIVIMTLMIFFYNKYGSKDINSLNGDSNTNDNNAKNNTFVICYFYY